MTKITIERLAGVLAKAHPNWGECRCLREAKRLWIVEVAPNRKKVRK